MEQLNQNQQVKRQVTLMFKAFEDSRYRISDYKDAICYFQQLKRNRLKRAESILKLQEKESFPYNHFIEEVSLLKDTLVSINDLVSFFDELLTSNGSLKPLCLQTAATLSYALMIDLNDFHALNFDFEVGDPIKDAVLYASLTERLEDVRTFLASLPSE